METGIPNQARLLPASNGVRNRDFSGAIRVPDYARFDLHRRELLDAARYHEGPMNPDKPVHADNIPTNQPRRQIPHEQISARAEQIWRERNQPTGNDEAIWLEAESQLQAEAESKPVAGTPSRPYVDEPAKQLRSRTKVQDPAESAVQPRAATENKARKSGKELRNQ